MKKTIISLLLISANLSFAADPFVPVRVDLSARRDAFTFELYQAESTTVRVYFYNDGSTWTGATNYSGVLGYGTNYADSTSMVLSSNTFTAATAYLDFDFTASQLNTNGNFYAQLMVTNAAGKKWVFNDGYVRIKKSPISGGATAQVFTTPVNWDVVENLGTVPWGDSIHPVTSVAGRTGDVVITSADLADFQTAVSNNTLVAGAVQNEVDPVYSLNTYAVAMNQDVSSTGTPTFVRVNTPAVRATTSAGGALQTSGGDNCLTWGAGGCTVSTADGLAVNGALLVQGTNIISEIAGKVSSLGGDITGNISIGTNLYVNTTSSLLRGNADNGRIFVTGGADTTNTHTMQLFGDSTKAGFSYSQIINGNPFPAASSSFTTSGGRLWSFGTLAGTISNVIIKADSGTVVEDADESIEIVNYQTATGLIATAVSGYVPTSREHDACSPVYELFSVDGTATVSRTFSDTYYREFALILTNETVISFDASFPTNRGTVLGMVLNPNGQTYSADYTTIDSNSWVGITLVTNAYNRLIFDKAPYETTFYVTVRP